MAYLNAVTTFRLVGATGFEPAAPWSQTKCATKLRHAPTNLYIILVSDGFVNSGLQFSFICFSALQKQSFAVYCYETGGNRYDFGNRTSLSAGDDAGGLAGLGGDSSGSVGNVRI